MKLDKEYKQKRNMISHEDEYAWQAFHQKVTYLKQGTSFDEPGENIETIETHMSWVFLTKNHAYKIKKPVSFSYLNLDSLEKRYINCQKELYLNQFLAPHIYLNIIPLCQNKTGEFCPVGHCDQGVVVDWLLKMRRFPREKMLDEAIKKQDVDEDILFKAILMLIDFYQSSPAIHMPPEEYERRYYKKINENHQVLSRSRYRLDEYLVHEIHKKQHEELKQMLEEIHNRVKQGRIIECHGDLRPEHICLVSPPIITDRLEFNRQLRIMDPIDELSYLAMECELLGDTKNAHFILNAYQEKTQDQYSSRLITFYKSYRACIRAKISAWHLDDKRVSDVDKWHKKASIYLEKALEIFN